MPDSYRAYQMELHRKITTACKEAWATTPNNCNDYVCAVVNRLLGTRTLYGNANKIYELIQKPPWTRLPGSGKGVADLAGVMGSEGYLVVAASQDLRPGKHGHVAIVVDYTNFYNDRIRDEENPGMIRGVPAHRAVVSYHQIGGIARDYAAITKSWREAALRSVIFSYVKLAL